MRGIIYRYVNKITGKVYIGQTTREEERKIEHLNAAVNGCSWVFYRALRKYGASNFRYEVLHEIINENSDYVRLKLNELEKLEIQLNNSINPYGYNMTNGGEGGDNGEAVKQWTKTPEGISDIQRRANERRDKDPDISKRCKNCKKPYMAKSSKSIFCCSRCRNDFYRKGKIYSDRYMVEMICKNCKKTFLASKYDIKYGKEYCSYRCAARGRLND